MKLVFEALNWRGLTLPVQFVFSGAIVMVAAMFFVGNWISERIKDSIVQNSAASAALFMESVISPLSQELAQTDTLSPPARQALIEVFEGTAIGERVPSYKIWLEDGMIVHAADATLIGQTFAPSDDLKRAFAGEVAAAFEALDELENQSEAALGIPLLEVYSPIRQAWTGEVIAVAEFYENAEALGIDIENARRTGWLVVGGTFLASGLLLFGIVQAGGRTIRQQREALTRQLETTQKISAQNAVLRRRVVAASARATAQTERAIRRIGSDLHDGPAQYLSLASLRLHGALDGTAATSEDTTLVQDSLDNALNELRIISRGLALPDLDQLDLQSLIGRAVKDHSRQTGLAIDVTIDAPDSLALNYAQKLCVFRVLQEALSNASRHGRTDTAQVNVTSSNQTLALVISDQGQGFDTTEIRHIRPDGGQGLFGLIDRAESLGGQFDLWSEPGKGTRLTLTLPLDESTP
jgi:signal transduction histidine kinase